jgi:putative peptidoglycan lipid II flippase
VGILVDLGRPRSVTLAELALTREGATVELRAGDQQPSQAADLPVVGSTADAKTRTRLDISPAVTARYWLVWFTSVPRDTGGYGVGVAEVALLG